MGDNRDLLLIDGKYEFSKDWFLIDEEVIERMYNVRFYGMPSSFLLLDHRKTDTNCHFCSEYLNLVIPGSTRMKGRKDILGGGYHSWVEVGDFVYDTSALAKWRKEAYYDIDKPYEVVSIPSEVCYEDIKEQVECEGIPELYITWIGDLEEELDNKSYHPYERYLREHISRFKKEQKLDKVSVDEDIVLECHNELQEIYAQIARFKEENKVHKKKD